MLLIVQMIPAQALIIALFLDFNRLNLLQSLPGLILVYAAQALPVSIWMLRNFVATVPRELEEAAAVDGAGPFRIFWRVLFPLVVPGLIATSVFSFITAYNEFIVALTFLGQAHGLHAADLRDVLLRPRRRGVGADHGRVHPVHHPGGGVLPARAAPDDRRPGRRGGEGVTVPKEGAADWTDAPKGGAADWTEERGARNERQATREVGGSKPPGGAKQAEREEGSRRVQALRRHKANTAESQIQCFNGWLTRC